MNLSLAENFRNRLKEKQRVIEILSIICILSISGILLASYKLQEYSDIYDQLITQCNILNDSINAKKEYVSDYVYSLESQITQLNNVIKEQDKQLQSVSETNKSYVNELNYLRERNDLYNKYEYAIYDETGERTYLTYEEIKLGEELMLEMGYDPNLLFGTIMVESRGNPNMVNEATGATGYGQFMNETAEFVWTDLMGNSEYYPEIMKDGESNIKMMAYYYDYLYKMEGDTFNVIKTYSGNATDSGTYSYIAAINSFTSKVGANILN